MIEPTSDKHYESKFEFPLLKLIKQRAEEKDISYHDAALEVIPEYVRTIRYGDTEFEEAEIAKSEVDVKAAGEHWQELVKRWEEGA